MSNTSQLETIFFAALEKPTPTERKDYLDEVCAGDEEFRQRVERMLAAHNKVGSFLELPPFDLPPANDPPPITEQPGTVIGPYKLLEQIGEGGFGLVFVAEQQRPVRRQVGLKIIKPGMDTRQVIARFEAERQALALMDHPNIAKVFDAGATDSGRPYFVMELVRGVPITQYCDEHNLTVRERLELFTTLCHAIQHAHQKGIIHRDVKPTNVLVSLHDGRPVPKVIDFGVAKALSQQLTERTIYTQFAQMIGTPLYMSPEQAELNGLDIDTRSDIYSLGVVLYELLTGTTPFDRERLKSAAADEIRRIVREEEPPTPSKRLSQLSSRHTPCAVAAKSSRQAPHAVAEGAGVADGTSTNAARRCPVPATLATTAAKCHTEPARLVKNVRGELDWIVMKCLEKDRNRRYESANGLAADVEHYLKDEPVQACPPSISYRVGKFARRYRGALITTMAFVVTVLVGLTVSTFLIVQERDAAVEAAKREMMAAERERAAAKEAERERERAEANLLKAKEAVDRLFTQVADQLGGVPHMEQLKRKLLEDALEFYQEFLKQKSTDPVMRHETALAYFRVGKISRILGRADQAESASRQAVAMLEKLSAEFPAVREYREDLIESHGLHSFALRMKNDLGATIEEGRTVLRLTEQLASDFPDMPRYQEQLAYAHTDLGNGLQHLRPKEAEEHFRQAVALWEKVRQEFPEVDLDQYGVSHSHLWLGAFLSKTRRSREGETHIRLATALREQFVNENPEDLRQKQELTHAFWWMASTVLTNHKPQEAEQICRGAIQIQEMLVDEFPDVPDYRWRLGAFYGALGNALVMRGQNEEAEEALRRSIAVIAKMAPHWPNENALGLRQYELGRLLQDTGRSQEAAEAFRAAQSVFEDSALKYPDVPECPAILAQFLADCPASQFRDPARAERLAKQALQLAPEFGQHWFTLGMAQARAGHWSDALGSFTKSEELSKEFGEEDDVRRWFFLAMAHWQNGDKEEARAWYDRAAEWLDKESSYRPELRRYRMDAAELLGIAAPQSSTDQPTVEKEDE